MKTDLLTKNKEKPKSVKFRFQINAERLSKKNKELHDLDTKVLTKIRGKKEFLNGLHREGCIYNVINEVDLGCRELLSDYASEWFVMCQTLSYIHDICSIKASPDNYDNNLEDNILLEMFIRYSKDMGVKRISVKKYQCIVRWFTHHLCRVYKYNSLAILYSRDRNFNTKYEVKNRDFSYRVLIRFIDFLADNEYVLSYKGNVLYGTKCMSMLVVNPILYKLINVEDIPQGKCKSLDKPSVIVRDNTGVEVSLDKINDDLKSTVNYGLDVLNTYNHYLSERKVTVDNYEIPEIWFTRIHRIDHTTCGRVFDDGTIQGKTKVTRSWIEIDGEATVSLDFKSIHPSILLYRKGVSINDHDPYPQLPEIKVNKKLVNKFKKFYNLQSYNPVRNIVKRLMLCLINADSIESAAGACYKDLSKDNMKKGTYKEHTMKYVGLPKINLNDIALNIIEHNAVIREYLGTGIGNKLQKIDSDIIMRCLDILTKADIPVLPIHDALICKVSDKDSVEKVMADSFVFVVGEGSEGNCIIEEE